MYGEEKVMLTDAETNEPLLDDEGNPIYEETQMMTASLLKKEYGITLTAEQRLKHCIGFQCKKAWRGCVPVFDVYTILMLHDKGEL